jgi:hypothetical protein
MPLLEVGDGLSTAFLRRSPRGSASITNGNMRERERERERADRWLFHYVSLVPLTHPCDEVELVHVVFAWEEGLAAQ